MKKILSVLLTAALLLSSIPAVSFAEPELIGDSVSYGFYVGGVEVTSENASNITGSGITGKVSYDNETATLTLNNATISGEYQYNDYPKEKSSLCGKLKGNNKFTGDLVINLTGTNRIERGIKFTSSEIDVVGSGSLTVNAPYCETGSLVVVDCNAFYVGKDAAVTVNGETYTTCRALVADQVAVEGYLKLFSPSIQNSFGLEAKTSKSGVYITETGELEIYASASRSVQWACGIQTYQGE